MRVAAHLDYDESNGAMYAWVALIGYKYQENLEYEVDLFVFPTLGHAMNFYKPQLHGDWIQPEPGGKWIGYLKKNNIYNKILMKAMEIQLKQLLYMDDEKCMSLESQ